MIIVKKRILNRVINKNKLLICQYKQVFVRCHTKIKKWVILMLVTRELLNKEER